MDWYIPCFSKVSVLLLTLSSILLPTEGNSCSMECLKGPKIPYSDKKEKNENQLLSCASIFLLAVHYALCVLRIYPQVILPGVKNYASGEASSAVLGSNPRATLF